MNPTKVIYSTVSGEAISESVLSHYALEGPVACALFYRGLNDTYRVSANGVAFALRLYRHRWRTQEAIIGEINALRHLMGKGVAVAAPIPRADGEWLTAVEAPEGRRWAVLFHWVDGVTPKYIEPAHARLYGEFAARLHDAGDDLKSCSGRPSHDATYLLERPVASLRPCLDPLPSLASRFDAVVQRVAVRLERARDQLQDWGFCHGDLHGGNAHIDGERLVSFDFDCCGPGWRVYDLATYRWSARLRRVDAQAWRPFIEAYLQVRPAAAGMIEAVPLFVVLRHIWLHGYHAWNAVEDGASFQSDRYLDELVSFLEEIESEHSNP